MRATTVRKFNSIHFIIVFSAVLLLATVFLVLFFMFSKPIPENYVETKATIEDIQERETFDGSIEYSVYIDYTFNDETYTHKEYGKYDSFMKEGEEVTIFVNPDSPSEYLSDDSDMFIFPLLCGIFAVVGVVGLVYNIKKLINTRRNVE